MNSNRQGEPLHSGEIYETNRILLAQLVAGSGAKGEIFDIVPDLEEAHLQSFQRARSYDAIVVAGGVSVGAKDLVKPTLQKLGAKLDLWRVAVKPGKPFMFGRLGNTLVFGLPGNPVSAFVTFLLFARPALWKTGWPFVAGIAACACSPGRGTRESRRSAPLL